MVADSVTQKRQHESAAFFLLIEILLVLLKVVEVGGDFEVVVELCHLGIDALDIGADKFTVAEELIFVAAGCIECACAFNDYSVAFYSSITVQLLFLREGNEFIFCTENPDKP